MNIFALADVHLSDAVDKPMGVFGPQWEGHRDRIEKNWHAVVSAEDVVLLAGDLSWAMTLEGALPDLAFIDSLPGSKFFIKGNHDYWCGRPGRVKRALGDSMSLVRFDAHVRSGVGICGVRGWPWPGHPEYNPEKDEKHWRRALVRLRMSLEALAGLEWQVAVAMLHYPPRGPAGTTEMCEMIRDAGVRYCVYGHLHGNSLRDAFEGECEGVTYRCASADHVDFTPVLLFGV